jgi:hypothetical protein
MTHNIFKEDKQEELKIIDSGAIVRRYQKEEDIKRNSQNIHKAFLKTASSS